jgi:hypothetical protein
MLLISGLRLDDSTLSLLTVKRSLAQILRQKSPCPAIAVGFQFLKLSLWVADQPDRS